MGHRGLLIGELATRSGVSRKALRLYEAEGILPAPARSASGYRLYTDDAAGLVAFVTRARRLGFTLGEIREIVGIKRAGRAPCPHVRELVRRKAAELDRVAVDVATLQRRFRALLRSWRSYTGKTAIVCPHIEHGTSPKARRA